METISNPTGKGKRGHKWGACKSDLHTVTITCIGSNKQKPSTFDFSEVKYKPVGTEKECRAAIKSYNNCSLSEIGILNKDRMESHTALKPLREQIQPLKEIITPGISIAIIIIYMFGQYNWSRII
ncbi:hypothetical protein MAR_033961 [Mya arenaria]|uniref:Uncharacterized protein n=1 Tax=Mya arenaria TaxID=6604 RepID=A0ABY7GDJ7_MYAAR|nr:hypothetical protein MAR_033961 [Mya arenaria]